MKSEIFSEILSTVTPEVEERVKNKTIDTLIEANERFREDKHQIILTLKKCKTIIENVQEIDRDLRDDELELLVEIQEILNKQ